MQTTPTLTRSYRDATAQLPAGSMWSCSFGNPGEPGFVEYWTAPDGGGRWCIDNGPSLHPVLPWTCQEIAR